VAEQLRRDRRRLPRARSRVSIPRSGGGPLGGPSIPRTTDGPAVRLRGTFSLPQADRAELASSGRSLEFPSPASSPVWIVVVHKQRPGRQQPGRFLHRIIPRPGETCVDGSRRACHRACARGLREGKGPRSVRGRQSAIQRPNGDLVAIASGNADPADRPTVAISALSRIRPVIQARRQHRESPQAGYPARAGHGLHLGRRVPVDRSHWAPPI
jgi:hypothetical protein